VEVVQVRAKVDQVRSEEAVFYLKMDGNWLVATIIGRVATISRKVATITGKVATIPRKMTIKSRKSVLSFDLIRPKCLTHPIPFKKHHHISFHFP